MLPPGSEAASVELTLLAHELAATEGSERTLAALLHATGQRWRLREADRDKRERVLLAELESAAEELARLKSAQEHRAHGDHLSPQDEAVNELQSVREEMVAMLAHRDREEGRTPTLIKSPPSKAWAECMARLEREKDAEWQAIVDAEAARAELLKMEAVQQAHAEARPLRLPQWPCHDRQIESPS